jgi:hypothetical protein
MSPEELALAAALVAALLVGLVVLLRRQTCRGSTNPPTRFGIAPIRALAGPRLRRAGERRGDWAHLLP